MLDRIENDGLVAHCAEVGAYLKSRLKDLIGGLPLVGDVRGEGLFLGVEFVADKVSKQVLNPTLGFAKRVEAACLDHGAIVLGARGTVESTRGDHLLLAPPLILTKGQADELAQAIRAGILQANAEIVG